MRLRELLAEKVESYDRPPKPGYSVGGRSVKVYVNPGKSEMKNLDRESKQATGSFRSIEHQGKHYVWDAYHANHHDTFHGLSLSHPVTTSWFDSKSIEKHDHDIRKIHSDPENQVPVDIGEHS